MNRSILTAAIILFLFLQCFQLHSQGKELNENDTITCMQVIGLATENGFPINGIQVTLLKENEVMVKAELTSVMNPNHEFSFNLLGNSYYTIEISKPGYIKRLVSISTVIPNDALFDGDIFKFEFDVTLFKEIKGEDDYYLDFPVAIISYNSDTRKFENNDKYTKHIKTKIYETAKAFTTNDVPEMYNIYR